MNAEYNKWYTIEEDGLPEDYENVCWVDTMGCREISHQLIIATQNNGLGAFGAIENHWGHRMRFEHGEPIEVINKMPWDWEKYGHPLRRSLLPTDEIVAWMMPYLYQAPTIYDKLKKKTKLRKV